MGNILHFLFFLPSDFFFVGLNICPEQTETG